MNFKNKNAMTKKLSFALLIMLFLHLLFSLEAKPLSSQEEIVFIPIASVNNHVSQERNPPVSADITGHTLTVEFNENVGKARVIISNMLGVIVESETIPSTPNYVIFTISDADFYRIEIVTSSGDQYYGNFIIEN